MPAAFVWLGGDVTDPASWAVLGGSGDASDPSNYADNTDAALPQAGDDLYFGPTSGPCSPTLLPGGGHFGLEDMARLPNGLWEPFGSVHLLPGYRGTLTVYDPLSTVDLDLAGGEIDQPWTPDDSEEYDGTSWPAQIDVSGAFTWTGGVLNGTGDMSYLNLTAGSTAAVTPGGGALTTGDKFTFTADLAGLQPATGTFNPGQVTFNNGAGVEVDQYCTVTIAATGGDGSSGDSGGDCAPPAQPVVFTGKGNVSTLRGLVRLESGSYMQVNGGPFTLQDQATGRDQVVLNEGGTIRVLTGSNMTMNANDTSKTPFKQTAGTTTIDTGAKMAANGNGFYFGDSTLTTNVVKAGDYAKLTGTVVFNETTINYDGEQFGTLMIMGGNVTLTGGLFQPRVDMSTDRASDTLTIDQALTVYQDVDDGYFIFNVSPVVSNANNPVVGGSWLVVSAGGGAAGSLMNDRLDLFSDVWNRDGTSYYLQN